MRTLAGALLALAAILYPLMLWTLHGRVPGAALVALLAAIALGRIVVLDLDIGKKTAAAAAVLAFCAAAAWAASADPALHLLRLYPVLISCAGGAWFAWTLTTPEPAASRLARAAGMAPPAAKLGYLRVVTLIWVIFFVVNAAISAWTAVAASTATWSLYNGVVSYVLMGAIFLGEYLVRLRVQARERDARPASS